jgi:Spy/CpxP family protein refolding chaperone
MQRKTKFWQVAAVAAVVATGGGLMAAQAAKSFVPRQFVAQMAAQAQREWNLSNDQKIKIKAILQDTVPRGIAIHDDMKVEGATRQALLRELRSQTQAKIMEVLTPAQREKVSHWQQDAESRVRQTVVRVGHELKLTPQQQEKLRPIVADSFRQVKALRDNMNLTVAQKFTRVAQIHASTRARVDKVLSPAQQQQLDTISSEMRSEARHQFSLWRDTNSAL